MLPRDGASLVEAVPPSRVIWGSAPVIDPGQHCGMADDELVYAYWRHYQLSNSDDRSDRLAADELFWARERVDQAAKEGGPEIVGLLVALSDAAPDDAAPDDAARAYLCAGPIEDLVRLHRATLGTEIDAASRRSQSFATTLRSVW